MQVILRRVRQVDRGGDVDGLGPCVIGQEIVVVRKRFSQTQGAGVVEREADRLHIKYEAERGVGGFRCCRYTGGGRGRARDGIGWGGKKLLAGWQFFSNFVPMSRLTSARCRVYRQPDV